MLDDASYQHLVFFFAPVVALLDVEVFQVEGAVFEANVILAEALAHVDDVRHLFVVQLVIDGSNFFTFILGLGKKMLLGNDGHTAFDAAALHHDLRKLLALAC